MRIADNIVIRYGVWPVRGSGCRGRIIVLQGRGEFLEKYDETIGKLNDRGFDVYSFDWRGQGLSTRLLPNRLKGYINDYQDYIQDLVCFAHHMGLVASTERPLYILAHSMGGHIALRYLHDYPGTVTRAVLVAPMIDILTFSIPKWIIRCLARICITTGYANAYVPGSGGDYSPHRRFENNRLTSDKKRFTAEKTVIDRNPELAVYGVTFAWLQASLNSIDHIRQNGFAERIQTPVLIAGGGDDRIVSVEAQKMLCRGARHLRFVEIPGARHEILRESDSIQQMLWDEFDRFING